MWKEYRATWEAFSRSLHKLQGYAGTGRRDLMEAALLEVERARAEHNAARDRLAAHLSDRMRALDATDTRSDEERIRESAHLLWELAGRPQGTAEADWLGAERVVRSAAAA